jgi:hypothetical protein
VGAEKENGRRRKSSTTSSKEVEKEKVGDTGEKFKKKEKKKIEAERCRAHQELAYLYRDERGRRTRR